MQSDEHGSKQQHSRTPSAFRLPNKGNVRNLLLVQMYYSTARLKQ